MTTATTARFTPDDVLRRDDGLFELVHGELVEKHMGFREAKVANRISAVINAHAESRRLGSAFVEVTIQCYPLEPDLVRRPDVLYLSQSKMPDEAQSRGHCRAVPDLAVEVCSPNDLSEGLEDKIDEYFEAGVKLVWVVHTSRKRVRVHRPDGTAYDVAFNSEITGEDIIPGFHCKVAEFFANPLADPQS